MDVFLVVWSLIHVLAFLLKYMSSTQKPSVWSLEEPEDRHPNVSDLLESDLLSY